MENFLRKITLFIVTLLVAAFAFQLILSFRIKGKTIRGHDNLNQTSNINADLIFLGSSRCCAHFNPTFFDSILHLKTVNLGVDGHSELTMVKLRLKDYLARNNPPKFAVLNFDPIVTAGSISSNSNFVNKNDFARYAFFPDSLENQFMKYFKFTWEEKYIPLYSIFKYELLKDCIFLNHNISWLKYGYLPNRNNWDTISNPISSELIKYYVSNRNEVLKVKEELASLNQFCKNKGIQLLAIQTPVYKAVYVESIFKKTKKIMEDLNIPFIDMNIPFLVNNINFYYNSDHMNTKGVKEFQRLLITDSIFLHTLKVYRS